MHKSRLAGFIIDCDTRDLQGAARFCADALGMAIQRYRLPKARNTSRRSGRALHIEVQSVTHPSRVHLDIDLTT